MRNLADSDKIRAFIATSIPTDIRNKIADSTIDIFTKPEQLKIVKPDNYHLTLAFIGDISPDILEPLKNPFSLFCENFRQFHVQFGKIGTFPGVIFIKTIKGEEKLVDLASAVRTILRNNSVPYDNKPFKGHLTLARMRNRAMKASNCLVDDFQDKTYDINYIVEEFALIKSELTSTGPIYTTLSKHKLSQPSK